MSFDLMIGIIIGFLISFFVIKRSINRTGYGELKMCRNTCPYYKSAINNTSDEDGDDDQ